MLVITIIPHTQVLAASSSNGSANAPLERCVYSFGYGEHGRLGIGSEGKTRYPFRTETVIR